MRVRDDLNRALHRLLEQDPTLYLLGEDVLDPYGGAFRVTSGLSGRFPERVIGTPLSETALVGVAGGLALTGCSAIVEIMFADLLGLCFDQILNFVSKSVSMYGRTVRMPVMIRCPVGGNRGYGPTHSQSPQKHFIGIPDLVVAEMSPFHDNLQVMERLLREGLPSLFFEDKILYTRHRYGDGIVDDVFRFDFPGGEWARVYAEPEHEIDCLLVVPGGLAWSASRRRGPREPAGRRRPPCSSSARCGEGSPVPLRPSTPAAARSPTRVTWNAPCSSRGRPSNEPSRSTGMHEIVLPKLNSNDISYVLIEWLFDEGRPVPRNSTVAVVETSKAIEDIVAGGTGLLRKDVQVGQECPVGSVIGRLLTEEELLAEEERLPPPGDPAAPAVT